MTRKIRKLRKNSMIGGVSEKELKAMSLKQLKGLSVADIEDVSVEQLEDIYRNADKLADAEYQDSDLHGNDYADDRRWRELNDIAEYLKVMLDAKKKEAMNDAIAIAQGRPSAAQLRSQEAKNIQEAKAQEAKNIQEAKALQEQAIQYEAKKDREDEANAARRSDIDKTRVQEAMEKVRLHEKQADDLNYCCFGSDAWNKAIDKENKAREDLFAIAPELRKRMPAKQRTREARPNPLMEGWKEPAHWASYGSYGGRTRKNKKYTRRHKKKRDKKANSYSRTILRHKKKRHKKANSYRRKH
jgi:hypothetical protein